MQFHSAYHRLLRTASRLPKNSPAYREVLAAQALDIDGAGVKKQFNLFIRLSILLGATDHPFSEVAVAAREGLRGLQSRLERLRADEAKALLDEKGEDKNQWFTGDMSRPDFYKLMLRAAMKRVQDPDIAYDMLSAATVGASDASGSLAYQLGKSRKIEGLTNPESAANALAKNISLRGFDILRRDSKSQKRDEPFDAPSEEEDSFAETYDAGYNNDNYFNNLFNSPGGRKILRMLDDKLFFTGAPAQQAIWEAIKEDTSLIVSNMALAAAYEERMGKPISPQRAGALQQTVFDQARRVMETDPEIRWELSVLNEASKLTLRRSAKKQRLAKFPRGEKMTVQEVAEVVGPEFAEMNENPPDSVLAVREQMAKQARRKTAGEYPLNPRAAIIYFGLAVEDYNIEEDADNGDEFALKLMNDGGRSLNKLEGDALKEVARMFGQRVSNEGHDSSGELVCKFGVNSWGDVKKALDVINRNYTGGDDEIDTNVRYVVARGFRLYPNGVNDVFYGEEPGAEGDLEEWLADHKDTATRRFAGIAKRAYADDTLKDVLELLAELNNTAEDLADIIDARMGGEPSVADTFGAASDLSRWLRNSMRKDLQTHMNALKAQTRGKTAARYRNDPYWMTAKYPGKDKNGKPFRAGERVFYYPIGKVILTGKEAEAASQDFDAARFDEDGGY
jgi:hypothetical protein